MNKSITSLIGKLGRHIRLIWNISKEIYRSPSTYMQLQQNNDGTSYVSEVDHVKYAFINKEDYIKNVFNITQITFPEAIDK